MREHGLLRIDDVMIRCGEKPTEKQVAIDGELEYGFCFFPSRVVKGFFPSIVSEYAVFFEISIISTPAYAYAHTHTPYMQVVS